MAAQPRKPSLGHSCERVSEGDAGYREDRRRMSRPKCESVKHVRLDRPATMRKEWEANILHSKSRPRGEGLSSDGDGYAQKVDAMTP